ncbi:MAG: hypothetical protein IJ569_02245 [Prevotella sp.]|nr:hypothetical protein [Prevotella sp.]
MASLEEELRLDEEENRREMEYIRSQLPLDLEYHYSNSDILWIIDAIVDYYFTSGILESNEEEVDIDMEVVADYVCKKAREEKVSSSFDPQDVQIMVQADLDFQEQNM